MNLVKTLQRHMVVRPRSKNVAVLLVVRPGVIRIIIGRGRGPRQQERMTPGTWDFGRGVLRLVESVCEPSWAL